MQIVIVVMHALISIHALLAESDEPSSTRKLTNIIISIHALLAESDMLLRDSTGRSVISIHALLAESDELSNLLVLFCNLFLSTLSLRRATRHILTPKMSS